MEELFDEIVEDMMDFRDLSNYHKNSNYNVILGSRQNSTQLGQLGNYNNPYGIGAGAGGVGNKRDSLKLPEKNANVLINKLSNTNHSNTSGNSGNTNNTFSNPGSNPVSRQGSQLSQLSDFRTENFGVGSIGIAPQLQSIASGGNQSNSSFLIPMTPTQGHDDKENHKRFTSFNSSDLQIDESARNVDLSNINFRGIFFCYPFRLSC